MRIMMEELDTHHNMNDHNNITTTITTMLVKRRRQSTDKLTPIRYFSQQNIDPVHVKNDLEFEDLRHESLNQILKHNMEIFKDTDMHHFDDGMEDDENNNSNNNTDSLNGESLSGLNHVSSVGDTNNNAHCMNSIMGDADLINDGDSSNEKNRRNGNSIVQFNQLIDDERNSVNDEDDVSSCFFSS